MSHITNDQGTSTLEPTGDQLRLTSLVVQLVERMKHVIREIGDDMGLSVPQLDVLRRLDTNGPTPMSRLAEQLNCEASNLTGLVDKLESRDLVERRSDPADRRVKMLALTEDGRAASHTAWFAVARGYPFSDLTGTQREILADLIERCL